LKQRCGSDPDPHHFGSWIQIRIKLEAGPRSA
jgi:hypothetical protein